VHGQTGFVPYEPEGTPLAVVERSQNWFAGRRGNVPPARVLAALVTGDKA